MVQPTNMKLFVRFTLSQVMNVIIHISVYVIEETFNMFFSWLGYNRSSI